MGLPWYEVVEAHAALDQGDLIPGCPVFAWRAGEASLHESLPTGGTLRSLAEVTTVDAVVMTQTCDLAHANTCRRRSRGSSCASAFPLTSRRPGRRSTRRRGYSPPV